MVPVGIILVFFEVVIELVVEVVERRFLVGGRLRDYQILLVADLLLPIPSTLVMSALGLAYGTLVGGLYAAAGREIRRPGITEPARGSMREVQQ